MTLNGQPVRARSPRWEEAIDLDDLRPGTDAKPLQLVHPATGADLLHEGNPVVLMVLGPDNPKMQAIERHINDRRLKVASRTGRVTITAEEVEDETVRRLASAMTGWTNVHRGGEELPYSEAAALNLMREFSWMRNQVDAFHRNDGNFLTPSESNSKLN